MRRALLADLLQDARAGFACGDNPPDGVLQFRMNNVTRSGAIDLSKTRRVPATSRSLDSYMLSEGDVLFNATNSPELVGKTAFVSRLPEPAVFSNHFLRLRPKRSVADGRYLSLWLQKRFDEGAFQSMCRQWVGQATINRDRLLAEQIPLPSLSEQRRMPKCCTAPRTCAPSDAKPSCNWTRSPSRSFSNCSATRLRIREDGCALHSSS